MSHVRVNNVWREDNRQFVRVSNVWREVDTTYGRVSGVWRESWKREIELINVTPQVAWEGYNGTTLDWSQESDGVGIQSLSTGEKFYQTVDLYNMSRFTSLRVTWSCPHFVFGTIGIGIGDKGANTWNGVIYKTSGWDGVITDSVAIPPSVTTNKAVRIALTSDADNRINLRFIIHRLVLV